MVSVPVLTYNWLSLQGRNSLGSGPVKRAHHHSSLWRSLQTAGSASTRTVLLSSVMPHGLALHHLNLIHGGCIRVKGELAADPKSFTVNMGRDEKNLSLHINPRFKLFGDVKKLIYNSMKAGTWDTELRDSVFPFQPGTVTEVCISFDKAELTIKLPDGHTFKFPNRHNVDTIDYLEIHGDLKLQSLTFE